MSPTANGVNGRSKEDDEVLVGDNRASAVGDNIPGTSSFTLKDEPVENFRKLRVVVIGAGYSGIYCAIRIPERLRNVDLCVYEKNNGLGGTWFENRYVGCACDIPSHSYQYSFAPNTEWSSFYAPAKEIHTYLDGVARKYSADRFIKTGHEVKGCYFDKKLGKWKITVEDLASGRVIDDLADVLISARGMLNNPAWPDLEGLQSFKGKVLHSAKWDEEYDFSQKRIGIIGGGSSAIQIIPNLQKLPGTRLSCFIRGKTWISPPFGDNSMKLLGIDHTLFTEADRRQYFSDPERYRAFRKVIEADGNSVHSITLKGSEMQNGARAFFKQQMEARLAKKPEIADLLVPSFSVGCRRLTPGPGFLEALTEENVDFIPTKIARVNPDGIELADGRQVDIDVLICATGFQTSAPPPFPVVGPDGLTLASRFEPYPETYLSIATDGFPNFFMMLGPNSAIGSGSLTMMIESMGDYIVKCVRKLQKEDIRTMTVACDAVADFSEYIDAYFSKTVYLDECRSWYRSEGGAGTRILGLWPGSTLHAIETLRSPRWEDFEYTYIVDENGKRGNRLKWLGNGWSSLQVDGGDVAYYIEPQYQDVPTAPLPEQTPFHAVRSFSH